MGTYSSTWQVDIRRTSMDSPIVDVDGVPHANIAGIKGVPIANVQSIDGVRMKDYRWQVTITA